MNFILNFLVKGVTSWQSTALAGWTAFLTTFLAHSGLIDPQYVNSVAGTIAQWSMGAVSIALLLIEDRKQDNNPSGDNK